jgi:DNA-binding NarL/FixJ family response regulator
VAVRVLLVDDEPIFLEAVSALLSGDDRVEVVGAAHDGARALALALETRPQVVLLDLAMPGMDGYELTRRLVAQEPGTRVIAISGVVRGDAETAARAAGAHGFLLKGDLYGEIVEAILAAAGGLPLQ